MREHQQAKRASNREQSAARLTREGIAFVSKNGGAHLIVLGSIDLWPGTGLFIDRKTRVKGRGIKRLLRFIRQQQQGAPSEA